MSSASTALPVSDPVGTHILDKIHGVLSNASRDQFEAFVELVASSRRIFVVGAGRSGLVARMCGMRLMHLGHAVYIVGETTTPAIARDDLLIAISCSGTTASVTHVAETAKAAGAHVASITVFNGAEPPLVRASDFAIRLERRTRRRTLRHDRPERKTDRRSDTPLGTCFELSALIYLEAVVAECIQTAGASEDELRLRHTNLE